MFDQPFYKNVIDLLRECPPKTAILSDIDGTLHPIIENPSKIQFYDYIPTVLENLAKKYALVGLVTGRSLDSALEMIKASGIIYLGNHGMEFCNDGTRGLADGIQEYLPKIRSAITDMQQSSLAETQGIIVEDKSVSAAIHFRQAPQLLADVEKLTASISGKYGLKVVKGRKVRELHPPVDINKGTAVIDLLKRQGINLVLYMGDDVSDIEVFKQLKQAQWPRFQSITIGIRSAEVPQMEAEATVDYLIDNVDESIELLRMLL